MLKIQKKIAIIATIIFAIILFCGNTFATTLIDDSDPAVDPIPGDDAYSRSISDVVHGRKGTEIYTIEDIVFNRVPALDVNIFSDTAGGYAVEDGSVIKFIRTMVAQWYVSFRNLSIIVVAILIVYTGIKMSLATIAEQKAQYKKELVGWITGLAVVVAVHFVIILLMYANQVILNMLQQTTAGETSVYNTIKTRAYDLRFSIGMPAAIMYIALIIIWVRFIWTYAKRFFQTMILIVIAPFMGIRVAVDTANGKGTAALGNWFYELWTNIFLQSIHALVYVLLMQIAMKIARQNLAGFILALVFMHMILEFDDVFMTIFKFGDKKGPDGRAAPLKTRFRDDLATIIGVGVIGKYAQGLSGNASKIGMTLGSGARYAGMHVNDKLRKKSDTGRSVFDDMHNDFADWQNEKDQKRIDRLREREEGLDALNKRNDELADLIQLRMNARKQGEVGQSSRKTIKLRKQIKKQRFRANQKALTQFVSGTVGLATAIPLTVASDIKVGLTTATVATGNLLDATGAYIKSKRYNDAKNAGVLKEYKKTNKIPEEEEKFDNLPGAIKNVNRANELLEEIEAQVDVIKDKSVKAQVIKDLKDIVNTPANQEQLNTYIDNYIADTAAKVDQRNANDLMKYVIKKVNKNSTLSDDVKQQVMMRSQDIISEILEQDLGQESTKLAVSSEISKLIARCKMSPEHREIGENMFAVMDLNDRATKQTSSRLIDTNQFVNGLAQKAGVNIKK